MLPIYLNLAILVLILPDIIGQGVQEELSVLGSHHDPGVNPGLGDPWEDPSEVHHEFGG